jgi:hypothetical protein
MFLIVSSQIFADGNASFIWQLNNYQENAQKINFINLNPMFFNDYFLLNIYKNISPNPNNLLNRNVQTISQNNNLDILTEILYLGTIITGWSANYPAEARYIQNDTWRQQREIENFYRSTPPYLPKLFYQNIPY